MEVNDVISRQAAIDALGDEPEVWTGKDEYAMGLNNQWHYDRNAIKAVPSAQPKPHYDEWCTDCKEYDTNKHCCPRWNRVIRQTLKDAQPEQQWIPCSEPPKESGTYIVTAYDGTDKRVTFVKYQKTLKRWDLTGARAYWRILAYKPLPEPYKEKDNEKA